jgi:integrase
MSVVRRDNSKYWYVQFQMNGRTYIRSARTTNRKAAEQLESSWRAKIHAQQYLGTRERITFGDAIKQFVATKQGTPNYRNLTAHEAVIGRLMSPLRPLNEVTLQDLERFKRDRQAEGVSTQTLKHSLNLIRGAWRHARKLGYSVDELDFPQVKLPKYQLRYLSTEEEHRLLAQLDPRREVKGLKPYHLRDVELKRTMQDAYDLVVLLLDTGARYSEVANIKWSQIRLTEREIHLWRPKVQNETILYMTDRVHEVLSRRVLEYCNLYVFRNKRGGPRGYASQAIRKALRKAGLGDCRIHTLRHTLASRLIQNGMSIYEVREILGHTDVKTTMRYAHLEQREVARKAKDLMNRLNQQATEAS